MIWLLVEAGTDGIAAGEVAKAAGIADAKGSSPLLREVLRLLDVGPNAVKRPRTAEGKRWVLVPKARKAAAKVGLLHAEADRP